jgi:tetratricopeptide (TPR) repeat protein
VGPIGITTSKISRIAVSGLVALVAVIIPALLLADATAAITIDYPEEGSLFPPEITPPTFLWRDGERTARVWRIEVTFTDGSPGIHTTSKGERMRIGEIDPDCVSPSNELPRLTPQQAAELTWTPGAATWESIKKHSISGPATVTITGFPNLKMEHAVSRGRVTIRTSTDPVGAPIFYRDVPLMPTETEKGSIKPLAPSALPLVNWRLRNVGEARSRLLLEDLPVCANCHSFSADGKTLGMDLDGLQNNKGLYILAPVTPQMSIRNDQVIQWSSPQGRLRDQARVGFMSQVSPNGQYVVTTINPSGLDRDRDSSANLPAAPSNYYVTNFKDYRFLQVFYPTRGILAWYSRSAGVLQPLPGADDRRFVQMGAVWSPDGKYLVFARAQAREPYLQGAPLAQFANDPNERQIQYDLYRILFRGGQGGAPEPIAGASRNGMSNSFPKVSPDGRWIVFVKCCNGLLMRPDSQLYIVPATGGQARRMRCNTARMNSWHSFSPNGRWLVFASKSRSPYTQMYLTHIDSEGNDSPAILIENATAANRAVNIPEFVNVEPDGLRTIGGPVIQYYKLFNSALYLQKQGRYEESVARWKQVLEVSPDDPLALNNLGMALVLAGHRGEAVTHFQKATEAKLRKALEVNPGSAETHDTLGLLLLKTGRLDEAILHFQKAAELKPGFASARSNLGSALAMKGRLDEALAQLRKALELDSAHAPAYYNSGLVLAKRGETEEAIRQWQKAVAINPSYAEAHATLGDALYARDKIPEALAHWREAIRLQPNDLATLRQAAWVLATCPQATIRNGSEALALAVRAVQLSGGNDAVVLDTLAAAYAQAGRFADAVLTARRALALAAQKNQQAQAEALKGRIALYEAQTPFRETRGSPVAP